jgi:hypothetical protein
LINRVVPGFDLLEEAVKLPEALDTKPPLTLAAIHPGMDASIATAWRSRRLLLRASSRPMMLGKVWRHSWSNAVRHLSR